MAVQTMRSLTYLQPGEQASCVGCHEHRTTAPPVGERRPWPAAASRRRSRPAPTARSRSATPILVQPVLDKHCVECHGGEKTEGGIDLTGAPDGPVHRVLQRPGAAGALLRVEGHAAGQSRTADPPEPVRRRASRLMQLLLEGHEDVDADRRGDRAAGHLDGHQRPVLRHLRPRGPDSASSAASGSPARRWSKKKGSGVFFLTETGGQMVISRPCHDDCELPAGDMRTMCSTGPWGGCGSSPSSGTSRPSRRSSAQAKERLPMRVLAWCVMSNHWHFVLWPRGDGDLSEFMRWLTVTHTQRWHAAHRTAGTGPLYQGRFKSFPIQEDDHLLTVLALRGAQPAAGESGRRGGRMAVVEPLASAARRRARTAGPRAPAVAARLARSTCNVPRREAELAALRRSVVRGSPFGEAAWQEQTAKRLGLRIDTPPSRSPSQNTTQGKLDDLRLPTPFGGQFLGGIAVAGAVGSQAGHWERTRNENGKTTKTRKIQNLLTKKKLRPSLCRAFHWPSPKLENPGILRSQNELA